MATPTIPAALTQELRELARRYGSHTLVAACADMLCQFARRGVTAALTERRAKTESTEKCPRCLERDALFAEMKRVVRPAPPEGRQSDGQEAEG